MPTMPGEIDESWSPEGEAQTRAITAREPVYKPEMGAKVPTGPGPVNPYAQFIQDAPEPVIQSERPGWKERFIANYHAAQRYGTPGMDELGEIRDQQMIRDDIGPYRQTPEDAEMDAQRLREKRIEAEKAYEMMPGSETALDYAAAIIGGFSGSVADPLSALGPTIKVGTTGWRAASPVLARLLDGGVSNAAMNAAINATVQAEEGLASIRDEFDWRSFLTDVAAGGVFGAAFSLPGAITDARAQRFYEAEAQAGDFENAPAQPAPDNVADVPQITEAPAPEELAGPATWESLSGRYSTEDLNTAQEALFGEVVGTRNLTPEQLIQLEDTINASRPYGEADMGNPASAQERQGAFITDGQGKRKTFYRGLMSTPQDSNTLQFWTDDPAVASLYVSRFGDPEETPNISPAYIRASKPYQLQDAAAVKQLAEWADVPRPAAGAPVWSVLGGNGAGTDPAAHQRIISALRERGFDSIEIPDEVGDVFHKTIVTFGTGPTESIFSPPIASDYRDFRPDELKVDAQRFQFKGGGDAEGVIDTLKNVKKWDRKKSGTIIVWQDLDGNNFVVDGHQRYGLAKRLKAEGQDPVLHAMIWREADGITADEARVMAADINISQGSGTAIDAAKILRSRPEMLQNLPKNAVTEHGVGLAALSDDGFGMVVNGVVPPEYGALVGKLAPNKTTHSQIIDVLAKNDPSSAAQAESMIRDVLSAPEVEQTMADMFGSAEVTQILFKERAQILTSAATALRKDRAAFNTLVKEEARLTGAGNQLATKTNMERAQTDAEILATLQATARRKGPVADALAAAAKQLAEGGNSPAARQAATRDFLDNIRRQVTGAPEDGPGVSPSSQSIAASLGGYRNTDSPAFKRWFGKSKVVDKDGSPLPMYHGTAEAFSAFSKGDGVIPNFPNAQSVLGHFFTSSQGMASKYAVEFGPHGGYGTNVIPTYLSIRSPKVEPLDLIDEIETKWSYGDAEAYKAKLQSEGHDGILFTGYRGKWGKVDEWVVFSPTQIKSIFNRGTWDATDPNISNAFMRPNQLFREKVQGSNVFFPDAEHQRLYNHGAELLNGRNPAPKASEDLFRTFKGFVEESEADPFASPADLDEMAIEYATLIRSQAEGGRTIEAIDMIANDEARVEWLQRTPNATPRPRRVQNPDDAPQFAFSKRARQEGPSLFDVGADNKPQMVLPGAERASPATMAQRAADAPLKAKKAQKDLDFGLFGDSRNQLDLVDLAKVPKMTKADADYLDFRPSGSARSAKIGNTTINYAAKDGEVEILSVRTPMQFRRQGAAREALLAFLEKADEQGLAVRAYSTPLDRMTHREGIIRLYERLGFTATGRKINAAGDIEMLRSGPPPEVKELRDLVGSGRLIPLADYTDPEMSKVVKKAFFNTQPDRSIAELYDGGILQKRQAELAAAGREIEAEIGARFADPGVKDRAKAEEKITRKGYRSAKQLTDLVRAGFMVTTPDQAQRIVNLLASRFTVLDEGWTVTPEFYFDRKIAVRFRDGTIGEVQIWHPDLINAKNTKGHALYEAWRVLDPATPEARSIRDEMESLYRPIVEGLDPSWGATVGRGGNWPNVSENSLAISSSPVSRTPESDTSAGWTGDQSSPGASTAKAGPSSVTTAGRSSQSTNFMGQSPVSGQDMAFSKRPQPGSNMPVNRPQAGTVARRKVKGERLEDISADLARLTGSPVRQGRLQRAPGGQVAGQFDRRQGVIRLRDMTDFETQTHETAHALETQFGVALQTIKKAHAQELEPLAYAGADPRQLLSEGFAEWFRFYVTAPNYIRNNAPQFTAAFERMMPPDMIKQIAGLQQRYLRWTNTPSGAAVAADVVSSKQGGAVSEMVEEARRNGVKPAIANWASQAYTAMIDKLNPIYRSVEELMKVYEARTGQALDITSAQDPYRLARLLQDSYSAGHMDAMHGVVPYRGVVSQGPGLADALEKALGRQWQGWDDDLMADFAAYLISRRAVREYDRFMAGEIPNPPGKFTRGDYEVTIQEMEAAHPEWAEAAQMVYAWGKNMLRKKYEAGFITQDLYQELSIREDYVPFMRDLTDLDRVPGGEGNATLRNSIMKAFRGSKRSIINPLESMLADAYQTNALIRRNDVFKALDDLARMAGPGSGAIVERIPSTQLKGTTVGVDEVLKTAAKEAGLNPSDVDILTTFVDDLIGENQKATIFRAGEINEKGEPIVYVWRDGKKQALRLADGDFGREMFDALTGMNKEARNLFVNVLALPTTIVRYGVTTAPHFVLANYFRDQVSAWVLAGDGFIPFISGASGLRDEITQSEVTRIYNSFGGIMGGANVSALDKGRVKRDISALQKKGYAIKRFAGIRGFAEFTELTETGTRLGIFKNAFARAKRDGLTDYEAAVEAAFQSRDYIDFGRHGSQTHTARRLVTFLNASLQGLDKSFRVLTGEGSIRKAIAPYVMHRTGRPLSKRDRANITKAAAAWAKVTAIGVFGLGLSALYRDDPEYEEISDYLRATHWMVKIGPGEWFAIPKPFELGFISNLFERGFDSVYGRNPIAMQSFLSGLYEVTAPPMGIPIFETFYEMKHNTDSLGRPIVGQDIAGFDPWRQYTAQTSEIAKALGKAVNVSPAMIDHAIQGFGASWGRIITQASSDVGQERGLGETAANIVSRRFIRDVTAGATSTRAFWDNMSESSGPLIQAANTYKDLYENRGEAEAETMISSKDENTKAMAYLTTHFEAKVERLHPMIRAKDAISAISKLRKEIAGNDVELVESDKDDPEKMILTPSTRHAAQEFLARLAMIEARNALITTEIPGWAQKDYMDTESLKADLRALSPELADELDARYAKKKVYDEGYVREVWPEVKSRVLEDRQDADFSDLTAGAAQ